MDTKESIKLAFKQLLSNKGRTLLTMLGMFIGVGSVIMILSLGEGFKDYTKAFYADIGLGSFTIVSKNSDGHNRITEEDLELISTMPEVETIMGVTYGNGKAYNKEGKVVNLTVVGSKPQYTTTIENVKLLAGRKLVDKDEEVSGKAILIPDLLAKVVLKEDNYESLLGTTVSITINNQPDSFEIVGVYKTSIPDNTPKEYLEVALSQYYTYMPLSTMNLIQGNDGSVSHAAGVIKAEYDQREITSQIRQLLNKRHQQKNGYTVTTAIDIIDTFESMLTMLTLFISAVASISLLVGGVGIMNIMLVTVKERTREIGVRKALGASNKMILRQFLVEALILTFVAGIIGMLFGYIGAILIGSMYDIQAKCTVGMLIFAAGTSTAIGILFGVYPAYQAAKLDPVESLRGE